MAFPHHFIMGFFQISRMLIDCIVQIISQRLPHIQIVCVGCRSTPDFLFSTTAFCPVLASGIFLYPVQQFLQAHISYCRFNLSPSQSCFCQVLDLLSCPDLLHAFFHLHRIQNSRIAFGSNQLFYTFFPDSQEFIRPPCILVCHNTISISDQFFYHSDQAQLYQNFYLWCLLIPFKIADRINSFPYCCRIFFQCTVLKDCSFHLLISFFQDRGFPDRNIGISVQIAVIPEVFPVIPVMLVIIDLELLTWLKICPGNLHSIQFFAGIEHFRAVLASDHP